VGAHTTEPPDARTRFGARDANERALPAWLARIESGRFDPPEREVLDEKTARAEAAFLALRTSKGLDAARFAAEFGSPPRHWFGPAIDALVSDDLLEERPNGDLVPGPRGLSFADAVAVRLLG
jgi:coproporphyrinogen III oxidase-like Fe-S oxidoreductase